MIIDTTAAARRPDPNRVNEWLANQRVFISSAMGDTDLERREVATAIEEEGARATRFEEFGRDADAEEAYLTEVDSSTVYVGIVNKQYGRLNPPDGFSATEAEFLRAREGGKRVAVFVAANAAAREGHLTRFIERVRYFITTENYTDAGDLARRVRRRLHELAAEALSPWVRLGDLAFRADRIDDHGDTITIHARTSDEIVHHLESARDQRFTTAHLTFIHRDRVVEADLSSVRRVTDASGADEVTIELTRVQPIRPNSSRAGTSGRSADDLIELGMRAVFLGEPLPESVRTLDFMTDPGIDIDDLRQAFDQANEIAEAISRLVIIAGLVGHGNASRVTDFRLGPRVGDVRRIAIEWEDPRMYSNVEPQRRRLEGDWRRPS